MFLLQITMRRMEVEVPAGEIQVLIEIYEMMVMNQTILAATTKEKELLLHIPLESRKQTLKILHLL